MTAITSYFNPCSRHHQACHKFRDLSTKQKAITCVATIFAVLLTLPLLGIGGLPVFIALTRKFSIIKPTGLEPRFTTLRSLCRNFDKIMTQVSDLSKKFQSIALSTPQKNQRLKEIQKLIEESKHVGKPTLSTKFGYCGTGEALSSAKRERQTANSGFAIVIPGNGSKLGNLPLFAIHDWKKECWHYKEENGQQVEMPWNELSEQDGVLFLSKIFHQPTQTIQDPLEHNSQFKAANPSNNTDREAAPFYQEKQVGNYCGKHAINAALGSHQLNKQSWGHEQFQGSSNVLSAFDKNQQIKQTHRESTYVIFGNQNFDYPSIKEMVQNSDRFIGATDKSIVHWKTYRLDRSTQEWWCIDSMKYETINGQETLYQYVVDIEKEWTKARNRQPKDFYTSGLILWLSYDEKVRYLLQMLQNIKKMEDLDTDSLDNFNLWHQVRHNLETLFKNSEDYECSEKLTHNLMLFKRYGTFTNKGRDNFFKHIDELIALLPQLKPLTTPT